MDPRDGTVLQTDVSGGFREGPSWLRPRPFGRRTDAVTVGLLLTSDNGTVLQKIPFGILKIITTSGFLTPLECIRPGPRWGSLQRSPEPFSWFKGGPCF